MGGWLKKKPTMLNILVVSSAGPRDSTTPRITYAHEHATQDQPLSAQDEQHPRDRIVGPVGLNLTLANYVIFLVCSFQQLLPSVHS
jgi:hypothetical protein